jgi:hypothetical protein
MFSMAYVEPSGTERHRLFDDAFMVMSLGSVGADGNLLACEQVLHGPFEILQGEAFAWGCLAKSFGA